MPNNPNDQNNQNNQNNNQNNYTQNVSPELEQQLGNQQDSTRNANAPAPGSTTNYEDISGDKQSYAPNSQGLSNTGSGAEAALGTDYTWNKQGSSQAQATYNNDVLTTKQNLLNNRQTVENNAVNYQAQADMMKYQNNQNAEKVGWTGGYVLDQNRQMEYLKASIQAQMYGAMELQKYGYDSSLAAARLSYDLNQQEYARQYYQEAVSAALSEAQLTGTYFSAETKDMMSQLAVAQQKENDPNLSNEEREQAKNIRESIYNWFSSNGISTEGVKTLEAWQQDQANELQWSNELWTRYQAAIEAANTNISDNPSEFIRLDANGKEVWDGTNVATGNWESWTNQDVADYLFSGIEGGINSQAVQQYYSYLDSTLVGETEAGFNKWCSSKGLITKDENGNTTIKAGDFTSLFLQYLKESNIAGRIANQFKDVKYDDDDQKNKEKQKLLEQIFDQWDFRFQMPDGTYKDYTYDELQEIESIANQPGGSAGDPGTPITQPNDPNNPDAGSTEIKDWAGNTLNNYSFTAPTKSQYGDYKSTLSQGSQICLTTAYWTGESGANTGGLKDADIAVHFGNNKSDDEANGFNVEIDSDDPKLSGVSNEINSMIYKATGEAPKHGQIITIGKVAYVYCLSTSDQKKLRDSGKTGWSVSGKNRDGQDIYKSDGWNVGMSSATGWYPIKGQCGGSQTSNELIDALDKSSMVV